MHLLPKIVHVSPIPRTLVATGNICLPYLVPMDLPGIVFCHGRGLTRARAQQSRHMSNDGMADLDGQEANGW